MGTKLITAVLTIAVTGAGGGLAFASADHKPEPVTESTHLIPPSYTPSTTSTTSTTTTVAPARKHQAVRVPAQRPTTTTLPTIPQYLVDRIPDSDITPAAEEEFCKATNQPLMSCKLPESAGMGEDVTGTDYGY